MRRFPLADPLWEDGDRNAVEKTPGEYFSGIMGDGADQMVLRPLSRLFYLPLSSPAVNVNALDEVPNSAWFTNRMGLNAFSVKDAGRGSCVGKPLDPKGPWIVVSAKPNGANPGFFIKAADGRRYLLKFDGPLQPQRATAADVIGSKIYYAAGYFAPCNRVVYFRRSVLKMSPKATTKDEYGVKRAMTREDVESVLAMAFSLKDGLLRASASEFLPGRPLGPFRYEGTRSDDPNDVIRHENRRDLRGARLLAAWLNHFDTREQNTLDVWVKDGGRHYIRHYYLDFGDCFGSRWALDGISRRLGYSYYLDLADVGEDFITLGLLHRPWFHARINPVSEIFGYYSSKRFVASKWKGGYGNPAFLEMEHGDALWMVRIIARFTDAHLREMVRQGRLTRTIDADYLVNTLARRRDLMVKEYLTRYSPLSHFRLVRRTPGSSVQSLCFEDLAIMRKVVDPKATLYKLRFMGGRKLERRLGWLQFSPDLGHPKRSCVVLPLGTRRPSELADKGAPDDDPMRYGEMKIFVHQDPSVPPTSSIHLYFYDLGPKRGFRLVGIRRPPRPLMPALY
ncbi:MAG: hypothetical protein KAI47_17665 [Deltaproteobacteria bacterium]|nr:hypothetical protein [Deltaproteobacteria bacterium]